MSYMPGVEPEMSENCPESVEMVIIPRTGDIGNFEVRRALPFREKRMVGPFIFWDQMGPGEFLTGQGVDVRPHPHIGLSTVTYLFDGTMDHKDSLGNDMRIVPGDVNLMTAGSGIVHSERTGLDIRKKPSKLFGIQSWLAQPKKFEEGDAAFHHTAKTDLPVFNEDGVNGRIILGSFEGLSSPVKTQWDTLYVDLDLEPQQKIRIPSNTEERAIYVVEGLIEIAGVSYEPQQMLVLRPGDEVVINAQTSVRMMLLGGAAMDGPRYIFWNFVSSSKERLEQAKVDWKNGNFPKVPGDEHEFIPLPE
ncbi:pirin family protein [Curvivirga aplysinae]|uniref:pirin family protein n=1 Tax=Curvivirga aplysinae TaxID=2529852 RepID=UPI0012BBD9A0|nr:pirin family protein [Curvivirga aplysinae]MTI09943.1 pirin family protein [Curvivirga aplysinae]